MLTPTQKTHVPKQQTLDRGQRWVLVNADGATLGRLATTIATLLRGKDKPVFTPHLDAGDHVVVINAAKVRVTGRKLDQKIYFRHTGYPGGLKRQTLRQLLASHPERVIEHAVKGMLPKNHMGRYLMTKLKVYAGSEHPHTAQKPQPLALGSPATGAS
jgi:large subunit ribosomal protein L13